MNELNLSDFDGVTPGEWHVLPDPTEPRLHVIWADYKTGLPVLVARTCFAPTSLDNASLFAASPQLLAEVRRLREENERLGESARRWGWDGAQDLLRWSELRFVAADRLEKEQKEGRNSSTQFTREWYSGRMETMHAWMRKADVPETVKHAYFSIVANGSAPGSMVSPELAQEYLNGKVTMPVLVEMDALRAESATDKATIERLTRERDKTAEIGFGLCSQIEELRARIATLERELAAAKEELNWQNHRNQNRPIRGGFEFYINEEWTCVASVALDSEDATSTATLMKRRYDPDDERVRIRRVIDDDALIAENASLREDKRVMGEALEKADRMVLHHCDPNGSPVFWGDWACAECKPHSDILKEGFQCAYHQALSRRTAAAATATQEGAR